MIGFDGWLLFFFTVYGLNPNVLSSTFVSKNVAENPKIKKKEKKQ